MKQIVFATNNPHKLDEVRRMLGEDIKLMSLADIGCHDDIPETAQTLEGNALQKAQYISRRYRMACFADDTGLEVSTLGGAPGVRSARYAGTGHDDKANRNKLLAALEGTTCRQARFRTVIALIEDPYGQAPLLFEGIVNGRIIEQERGNEGFGYDPLFVPDGYQKTFAELGADVKNKISHRAKAVEKLVKHLAAEKEKDNPRQ